MGDVRRSQRPRSSCGGPASTGVYLVRGQGRRWWGGESSVSRKRARSSAQPPPLPRRTPLRWYDSEDDDDDGNFIINDDDESHGRDDDDCEEDEQQISGSQDERGSSRGDESSCASGADDVVEVGGGEAVGGVEEQPPAEEGDSDDDRPISVVSRARTLVHRGSSPAPAPAPAPPELSPPSSSSFSDDSSSVIRNVTVENSSAFDCSICYLPLKSPIFQCTVGHVVCSPCHDKLGQATSCHVCRVPIPGGYFRCNAMEQVVDSIRVPCPHTAHGCAVKPAYHDREAHARTCAYKPCHCPGEGCGFVGPVQTTLLEHFAAVHGWPCSAGSTGTLDLLDVRLGKGFNVVVVTAGADQGTATEQQYTLVLNVEQTAPVCNTITAFCIHPSITSTVSLGLSYYRRWCRDSDLRSTYLQSSSQLDVVCTDLSNGMPGPSSCFPFLVPRWSAVPGGEDGDDIRITVNYIRAT